MKDALLVALAASGVFVAGASLYLVVTVLVAWRHTDPRPLGAALRSFLFELLCILVVQPFLPFFFLFGRRMGGARGGVPVVFVHGYFQNRVDFLYLARALGKAGLGPFYGINYPFLASVRSNAARLARFCDRVREETGAPEVDLVCHSMGGLVALEMLKDKVPRVRRCITVATPHAGVVFPGPIFTAAGRDLRKGSKLLLSHASAPPAVPVLSIFSSHDNVVHPKLTSALVARGGVDVEVPHFGHFGILFARPVAEKIIAFLREEAPASQAIEVPESLPGSQEGDKDASHLGGAATGR